jgi:hypothetical protein
MLRAVKLHQLTGSDSGRATVNSARRRLPRPAAAGELQRNAAHAGCRARGGSFGRVRCAARAAQLTRAAAGGDGELSLYGGGGEASGADAEEEVRLEPEAVLAELRSLPAGALHASEHVQRATSVAFISWLAERAER